MPYLEAFCYFFVRKAGLVAKGDQIAGEKLKKNFDKIASDYLVSVSNYSKIGDQEKSS